MLAPLNLLFRNRKVSLSAVPRSGPLSDTAWTQRAEFATTHWTVVLAGGQTNYPAAAQALEKLCRAYWYPLYVFVRRQGYPCHDAQELTQEFFSRLIEKNYLRDVAREKGKFRSFLLAAMKHFLANERKRAGRLKRGGGHGFVSLDREDAEARFLAEPATEETPEKTYEQRWATTVMEQALSQLRVEWVDAGKSEQFEQLKTFLSNEPAEGEYPQVAAKLNVTTGTLAVAVHRMRQRDGECVREVIAQSVAHPTDVEEEMRHLFAVLTDR